MKNMDEMLMKIRNIIVFSTLKICIDEFKYDQDVILKNFNLEIKSGDKICIKENQGVANYFG